MRISDWSSDVCSSDLGDSGGGPQPTALKLYCRGAPLPLSDVLPTLENFGMRVISQNPHEIRPKAGDSAWVQQFSVHLIGDSVLHAEQHGRATCRARVCQYV